MRSLCILILLCFSSTFFYSQNSFGIEYFVSNEGSDPNFQSLLIFSKDGNTISRLKRLSDNVEWYKSLRLKKQPKIDYQMFDSTYIEVPDKQLSEYEVKILGEDIFDKKKCVKIEVVSYKGGDKIILWITKEIPSYETYMDCFVNSIDLRKLNQSLKKINQTG